MKPESKRKILNAYESHRLTRGEFSGLGGSAAPKNPNENLTAELVWPQADYARGTQIEFLAGRTQKSGAL